MNAGATSLRRSRTTWLLILLALACIGCAASRSRPTQPRIVAEPLPGSFYLTSDRPAPYPLTIRGVESGAPSGRNSQFDEGEVIVLQWSTLPLPDQKRIEINGRLCEGTFGIQARIETDLLLILTDDACRVELLGSHPEGGPHHRPGE